jgi:predicted DsbA family dithiol-disulfide isomerase
MSLTIDVVSDVVCPWCYVGKRRLEQALDRWAQAHPEESAPQVTWQPFQLNPDLDPQGMPRADYIAKKFGNRGGGVYARVAAVGQQVGIPFAFDRITKQPNTVAAHSLIALAGEKGLQEAVVEALFRAYFIDGVDLSSRANLIKIATDAGLAQTDAEHAIDDEAIRTRTEAEDRRAREIGVEGVPFFIFNGTLGVSGAQPAEVLCDAMEQAVKE